MKKLRGSLLTHAKKAMYLLRYRNLPPRFLHTNVPYFSQWESRELNDDILKKKVRASDDPRWKESGAKTKEEYDVWSWSGCGMACTKMLLAHQTGQIIPLVKLGKMCAKYGGYTMPLEASQGLMYAPYARFLAKEFGLRSRVVSPLLPREIMYELSKGHYAIASVSPDIRRPDSNHRQKGGHLVLILGYDTEKQEFYFHNPSGDSKQTQEYAPISFTDFNKFFSGRGIVIPFSL
jgi:hypothetical protein